jgi:hypothetical protein
LQGKPREAVNFFMVNYLDRSYQKGFENAASDQFPLRLPLILFARALDRKLIEMAYSPLPDPAIPAAMNSGIYVLRDGSRLIADPNRFDENRRTNVDKHLENLNDLIRDHPDVNFYLFYLQRLIDSPYHPLNSIYSNADRGQLFAYFQKNKPSDLNFSSLTFSSLNDLLSSYYKTDHHWNIIGVRKAYEIIYQMLASKHPNLTPPLDLSNIQSVPGIKFLGIYARETLYPIKGENFEVSQINLPSYKETVNGDPLPFRQVSDVLHSSLPTGKYTNYYAIFNGNPQALMELDNPNVSTRNLLIIGSSFTRPLVPLLAAHYKHTYSVDLREYADFSFSEFVASHPVDDVLIVANDFVLYRDDWLIKP